MRILEKYNFELPKFSNQYFNRELPKIFKHYKLFSEIVTKKRRSNKDNQDVDYLKRDCISSHTCRRTFITLAISGNVPINTIMLASGHKKIQTLQSYSKKQSNREAFKAIDL